MNHRWIAFLAFSSVAGGCQTPNAGEFDIPLNKALQDLDTDEQTALCQWSLNKSQEMAPTPAQACTLAALRNTRDETECVAFVERCESQAIAEMPQCDTSAPNAPDCTAKVGQFMDCIEASLQSLLDYTESLDCDRSSIAAPPSETDLEACTSLFEECPKLRTQVISIR